MNKKLALLTEIECVKKEYAGAIARMNILMNTPAYEIALAECERYYELMNKLTVELIEGEE